MKPYFNCNLKSFHFQGTKEQVQKDLDNFEDQKQTPEDHQMAGDTPPQPSQENVNREDQCPLEMEEENENRGLEDGVFGGTNRDHPVFSGNSTRGSDTVKELSMRKLSEKPSQASLTSEHSFTDRTSTAVVLEPTKTPAKGRRTGLDGTDVPTATVMIRRLAVDQDTADRPHKCRQCSRAFKKASNLRSHEETHSGLKLHVCELCGKAYSHQGTLQQHRRVHTGERPYRCPFCSRTYVWSSDFCKHVRTHTGEKPYACSQCGKAFLRPSDLRKHERNMHANDRPLPCPQCGKTFNKPLSLLRHQRSHLGERPFRCPDCGKDFAVASRMVEHQKVHVGLRPHACDICSKAFTRASNLAEHRTLHSGLRPHKCPQCGVAFALPSRLARHQLVHTAR